MLGYGMTLPLFPFIIDSFGGKGIHLGLLVATYGIMQLSFAPFWGKTSDAIGRKKILILGITGLFISMIIFYLSKNLWHLYLGQIVLGSLTSAIFPVSMAYIIDITKQKDKAAAIGKIGAATGLGVVLGPGVGGMLAFDSLFFPFLVAAGIALTTLFFVVFMLPESLKNSDKKNKLDSAFNYKGVFSALRGPLGIGLLVVFSVNFGKSNFSSIFGLYALKSFNYGTTEVGTILVIMGLVYALVQGLLVGIVVKKYGDIKTMQFSLLGNAMGFVLLLFSQTFLFLIISISFLITFNALLKPTALSYVSSNSSLSQGESMGVADVYMSIGRIIGPLWAGVAFDINIFLPFITGFIFFLLMFFYCTTFYSSSVKANLSKN